MNEPSSMPLRHPVLWILLAILAAGSMSFYTIAVWSANQPPGFSDLYAPWWGAHEVLRQGRDPYSPAVAHQIQTVIYGAPATPSPDDPKGITGGFSYPAYAAFLLWPLLYLPFSAARAAFLWASILITLLSLWLWLRLFGLRPISLRAVTIAIFALGSFPALQAIELQNLSVIAAGLLALTLYLLSAKRFVLSGALLAVSSFKPQFMLLLIPWLAVWTVSEWRRRWALGAGFLVTMLALCLASQSVLPNWIPGFLNVVRAYRHYTYGHSLLDVWFTPKAGSVVAVAVLIAILAMCWRERVEPPGSRRFLLAISLLLAATLLVIPTLAPHAQLLLLPGIFCLLRDHAMLWRDSLSRLLLLTTWILLAWPWVAALGFLLASPLVPLSGLIGRWEIPLYSSPLLPLAVTLALVCALRGRSALPALTPADPN
jgi:hypothetical protein